jgi:N-acetylmuramoyl-L-alanine amidase
MVITDSFLTINKFSRPGKVRPSTVALIIHWFANPGQSAKECWKFYEDRKYGKTEYGSSNYLIGLDGEILKNMPEDEVSYNCGTIKIDPLSGKIYTNLAREKFGNYATDHINLSPNLVTLSIECSHANWSGEMTDKTIASLTELAKDICLRYKLNPDTDVLLHQEVVGWKPCHQWYVSHPEDWKKFKELLK